MTIKQGLTDKGKDVDLCSKCFHIFNMFMVDKDDCDNPVEMPLVEDGFECPRCRTHYAFEVPDEVITSDLGARIQKRRINVLYKGNNHVDVKTGIITHPPFVSFNCPICNMLLKIPKVVLEEVNK
ncbi:MAG: hypothetical protein K6E94_04185 [Elusimicrobiaceae bacterium]|nr:hypothetical protein [Elusimicrobiaceae bacterium]